MSTFAEQDFNPSEIIPNFDEKVFSKIETIFIWIDILGFKDKLKNIENYDELALLLDYFQDLFAQKEGLYRTTVISDGIVLELNPNREKWSFENVKACFDDIKRKQLEFILEKKYVIRGAIVVGTSRLKKEGDRNYISNGLSFAYELESKGINWPIIGTNGNYFNQINKMYREGDCQCPFKEVFKKTLTPNGQDVYFLDIYSGLEGKERSIIEDIIQNQLKSHQEEKERSVYNKYIWLYKCMHNYKGSKAALDAELEEIVL